MAPSVPYTVVFLWFSAATTPPRAQLDDLYDYGAARGLSFAPMSGPGALNPTGPYDSARVDRLEAELEQARTALSTLEEGAAAERLQRIEAELLAHPHLPQAAFLMAECLALKAQAAGQTPTAAELRARRAALEGPRAPAFGEVLTATDAAASPRAVEVAGLGPTDELELDGHVRGAAVGRVNLAPGLHHVRVLRAGRTVYAGFTEVLAEQQVLALKVPRVTPCSYDDLAGVDRELAATGAPLRHAVKCQRWALVRPERSGIGVALCGPESCGPFVQWQRRPAPAPFLPLAVDRSRLPSWAGFALAGAGAALATSFVLWQSGAFDRGQRAAATLKYGGLNP